PLPALYSFPTRRSSDLQISSAGENVRVPPGGPQQAHSLRFGRRANVFEGSHQAPAFCPSAARTRSGVSGRKGTRTPIALATALEDRKSTRLNSSHQIIS